MTGAETGWHAHAGAARRMPMGMACAVHAHRSWVPIERHHVWPLGMGGPDVAANKVAVCANGHYAVHEFMDRLIRTAGEVPWVEARHFGPKVRALAVRGWTEAGQPDSGGEAE